MIISHKDKPYFFLIIFLILPFLFPTISFPDAQKIFRENSKAVVMVVTFDKQGEQIGHGSGFVVRNNIIVTNLHVIENAYRGYVKVISAETHYEILGYLAVDAKTDLILLEVSGITASPLSLGDSHQIAVGDEVFAIGNPRKFEGTFSQGIISAIRKGALFFHSRDLLQITAPISPGSSGGPILNKSGEVIGIAVAEYEGGQNLNFAIPTSYLYELLGETKPRSPLSSLPTSKEVISDQSKTFHSIFTKDLTRLIPVTSFSKNDKVYLYTVWTGLTGKHEIKVLWIRPDKGVQETTQFKVKVPPNTKTYTSWAWLSFKKGLLDILPTEGKFIGPWKARLFLDEKFLIEYAFTVNS